MFYAKNIDQMAWSNSMEAVAFKALKQFNAGLPKKTCIFGFKNIAKNIIISFFSDI